MKRSTVLFVSIGGTTIITLLIWLGIHTNRLCRIQTSRVDTWAVNGAEPVPAETTKTDLTITLEDGTAIPQTENKYMIKPIWVLAESKVYLTFTQDIPDHVTVTCTPVYTDNGMRRLDPVNISLQQETIGYSLILPPKHQDALAIDYFMAYQITAWHGDHPLEYHFTVRLVNEMGQVVNSMPEVAPKISVTCGKTQIEMFPLCADLDGPALKRLPLFDSRTLPEVAGEMADTIQVDFGEHPPDKLIISREIYQYGQSSGYWHSCGAVELLPRWSSERVAEIQPEFAGSDKGSSISVSGDVRNGFQLVCRYTLSVSWGKDTHEYTFILTPPSAQ